MASGAMANRSTQSAAVRRLAALMEQDKQEEAQRLAEQKKKARARECSEETNLKNLRRRSAARVRGGVKIKAA